MDKTTLNIQSKTLGVSGGLILTAISATLLGYLPVISLILTCILSFLLYFFARLTSKRTPSQIATIVLWSMCLIVGVIIGLYRPEGFNYPLVFSVDQLHPGGKPFDLYINLGKAFAGYAILCFLLRNYKPQLFNLTTLMQVTVSITSVLMVILTAYLLLDMSWHPKWGTPLVSFLCVNLLVSVVSEEAFFRLLVQQPLCAWLPRVLKLHPFTGELLALTITTVLFVIVHPISDAASVVVYTLAGTVYGLCYMLSKNLLYPITVHFSVNTLHFIFLSYPI